ncbi:MAG: paraquat-inducible protein A [Salinisphaera sp.]|nr:paraquat-inducible protein A [Salinisphaera sp.]
MRLPPLNRREAAHCPRCGQQVASGRRMDHRQVAACSAAALLFLLMALGFDFLSLDLGAHGQTIDVPGAIIAMLVYGHPLVAASVLLAVVVLPALWLSGALYLTICLTLQRRLAAANQVAHGLRWLQPWLMADVFMVGAMISLIKIVILGTIGLGPAFYAFIVYAGLLLVTLALFDVSDFWRRFARVGSAQARPGRDAAGQGLARCDACGQPFDCRATSTCSYCGHRHPLLGAPRTQWTLAMIGTAAILLVPANLAPMLYSYSLGWSTASTIIGGVQQLIAEGSWPIAVLIFIASIVVPIAKILSLGWLCLQTRWPRPRVGAGDCWLYRTSLFIGRWSMIDIFVVTVVSALVNVGQVAAASPGPAVLPFAGAVILTMIAAILFDPRALWRRGQTAPTQADGSASGYEYEYPHG